MDWLYASEVALAGFGAGALYALTGVAFVLIDAQGGKAAFVATDLELQLTAWAEEGPATDTAFTVSARKLLDICRSLPDSDAISLEMAGEQLKLSAGKSRFRFARFGRSL